MDVPCERIWAGSSQWKLDAPKQDAPVGREFAGALLALMMAGKLGDLRWEKHQAPSALACASVAQVGTLADMLLSCLVASLELAQAGCTHCCPAQPSVHQVRQQQHLAVGWRPRSCCARVDGRDGREQDLRLAPK